MLIGLYRLAKKNDQAVMSFEINGISRNNRHIRVTHDVRIEVMKPQDVQRLAEPMCPEPDVRMYPPKICTQRLDTPCLGSHLVASAGQTSHRGRTPSFVI